MELDRFWGIIQESRADFDPTRINGNMDLQVQRLRQILSLMDPRDIAAFDNTFTKLFHDAYRWDLWAAGYIIEGGCGDDGFTDFRYWLISMGRRTYENATDDVESLADVAFKPGIEVTRFEDFGSSAADVLREMNVADDQCGLMHFQHPKSPSGKEWEDHDLAVRYPRLCAAEARFRS